MWFKTSKNILINISSFDKIQKNDDMRKPAIQFVNFNQVGTHHPHTLFYEENEKELRDADFQRIEDKLIK